MKKFSLSEKIYFGLIITLAILAVINVFLPYPQITSGAQLPAPKPILAIANAVIILVLYGGLGFIGLKLAQKIGFADIWNSGVSNTRRFLIPAVIGVFTGIFFIAADLIFSQFSSFGKFPHPPFPTSIVASAAAGIGEEVIFRLFFISFWVWLISLVILKRKWQNQVFWIVAVLSALAFAAGHLPGLMAIFGLENVSQIPNVVLGEIFLLNGVVSLLAAYYFRKFGFLAAVGIHFWTDIVWHVIWGLF